MKSLQVLQTLNDYKYDPLVWSVSDRRAEGARPEGQSGDSFAGASLSPGGTCVAALPTRRSQARRAETDFTAVQRAGACALSDVLTGSWSERREIYI